MKETVNVSIAGVAFILDKEGYEQLRDYLMRIELGYKENPDGGEVIADIEARICELILDEQPADRPVSAERIGAIITQLGLPDDINPAPADTAAETAERLTKRLYRNPEGAKLGGVCSGLATYFDSEVVLVRLLFFLPLLLCPIAGIFGWGSLAGIFGVLFGVGFMLYFILWFVIPKARTPRQKLEMRGEKITASSIHQNLKEDFRQVSPGEKGERNASVLSELIGVVGRILLFGIKALLLFIGGICALTIIAVLIGLISALVGGGIIGAVSISSLNLVGASPAVLVVLMSLLLLLPLGMLVYLLLAAVFRKHTHRTTLSVLTGIWIIILIYVGVIAVKNYERIEQAVHQGAISWSYEFDEDDEEERTVPPAQRIDSTWKETFALGDSIVTDTVHREYFTK